MKLSSENHNWLERNSQVSKLVWNMCVASSNNRWQLPKAAAEKHRVIGLQAILEMVAV
jgi:hypothetical protein